MKSTSVDARNAGKVRATPRIPPVGLVLLSVISVQIGAAFAKSLFPELGSQGTVLLRLGFAALVLLAVWRPKLRGYTRSNYLSVLLFGLSLGAMNAIFYEALARIPLGIAVTLEFVGPLGVALFGSRRPLDVVCAILAGVGIVLLAPIGETALDPIGVSLALLAGLCWAAYILLNVRVGRAFPGGSGLALGMLVGALLAAPAGVWEGGYNLLDPRLLAVGTLVALLSSIIPFSLELEALRKLPAPVFGVLLSTEPAMAALVGFLLLNESLGVREMLALVLITVAAVLSSRSGSHGQPPVVAPQP